MGEPACPEEEDGCAGDGGGCEAGAERGGDALHDADSPTSGCRGQRVGEEVACVGPEQVCDTADAVRSEDGEAHRAFGEIEDHRGEAGYGTEQHADEDDGEVLQGEGYGSEGERQRDVSADGHEGTGCDGEDDFAGEGFLKRSGAVGETELRGGGGLHAGDPFALLLLSCFCVAGGGVEGERQFCTFHTRRITRRLGSCRLFGHQQRYGSYGYQFRRSLQCRRYEVGTFLWE